MPTYVALLSKDADSDYGVHFPDFPGCFTSGSSLDEIRAMVEEVLPFHIEGIAEDGQSLARATSVQVVMAHPDHATCFPFLVQVDETGRTAQVDTTLNDAFARARSAAATKAA